MCSEKHRPRWQYTGGRSWLPEFLKVLQSTSGGDDLERDWPKFLLERFLSNSTPPQQLDFLAVRWAEADYGSYDQRIHVILGTPLYVAITPAATRLTELEVTRSENLTRTLDDRTRILAVDVLLPKIEEISEAADNSAYSHMIEALKDLRASYHALDLPANALQLDWRVLGIPEDKGPNLDREDIVIVLGNLAESCRALGRAAEALHLDKQALDIIEATPHPPPYMVRVALGNLAASYRALDRPTEALPLDERALAIAEAAPRPYHAELAIALGNLAATYRALGRAADALPLDERAIRIAEVALRPDDPRMAVALANLAATYRALGRIPEAKHLERVVGRMGSKPDHY